MHFLRASSSAIIMVGPMVASSDGFTPSTALALTTAPAIRFSKNGSTFSDRASTQTVTARANGYYTVPVSTADVGAIGRLTVAVCKNTTHLPWQKDYQVVGDNVYDCLYGSTGYLKVDTIQIESADATTQITQSVLNTTLEYSYTVKQGLRIACAALAGRSSGAGSTTLKFNAMGSSDKTRITAQCGSSGNRKGMTLDATT